MKEALDVGKLLELEGILKNYIPTQMVPVSTFTYNIDDYADLRCKITLMEKMLLNKYISYDEHWKGSREFRRTFAGKLIEITIAKRKLPNECILLKFDSGLSTFVWSNKGPGSTNSSRFFAVYNSAEDFASNRLLFELELDEFRNDSTYECFVFPEYIFGIF